jgi:ethanolamine transporter EutH
MPYKWYVDVVIPAASGYQSDVCDFGGGATRMGLIMPATFNSAVLSFQVAPTYDGTFVDLRNEAGTLIATGTRAQGYAYTLETTETYLTPWRFVKVRSGTTSGPTTQDADRTLRFVFQR